MTREQALVALFLHVILTVDAQRGRITAAGRPEGGMVFDVGLPPAA